MHVLANDTHITGELFNRAGKQFYDQARPGLSEYSDNMIFLKTFSPSNE